MYNVKKEVTQKVTNPQSISKMLYIFGIVADNIVISQLVTIKSQVNGFQMIRKNTKKNKNYVEIGFLIIFLNSYIDLLDLTELSNLFQIKEPRRCEELVQ